MFTLPFFKYVYKILKIRSIFYLKQFKIYLIITVSYLIKNIFKVIKTYSKYKYSYL